MLKNAFGRFVTFVAAAALWAAPLSAAPAKNLRAADLAALVRGIDAAVGDLSPHPGALFGNPEFVRIHAAPMPLAAQALSLLARADATENQKLVAVYAMQKLPVKEYAAFVEKLLELRAAGKITRRVYRNGAFPSFEWSTALAENYGDPSVAAFLKKARDAASSESEKRMIDSHLSGESAADIKKMREEGLLPK